MTTKLYEENSYTREFTSIVQACESVKNGYEVILAQTAFFPEGGGQPADTGVLEDEKNLAIFKVLDVQIKDGVIVHTVDDYIQPGIVVTGKIDWETRFSRMQNHTAEHLVSGIIHRRFGLDNVGFHLNDDYVTLDVSGVLSEAELQSVEDEANRAVYLNRKVYATYPKPEMLCNLNYRSKLDLTEGVRIVTIDGYDMCACCAPHVKATGEIGVIKFFDAIPYKGGMRITMLSGYPAFCDYAALHEANRRVMRLLSAPRDKVAEFVARDHDTIAALRAENAALAEKLVMAQLESVTVGNVVCGFTRDASFDALRVCTEKLAEDGKLCAVFSFTDNGDASYILSQENGDVRETVKALNTAFNGKGGGKPAYAQGKLTATRDQLLAFFKE